MLKKSTSGVLASLRGSTYRRVRFASSLAATLLDGRFVHPGAVTPSKPFDYVTLRVKTDFPRGLLVLDDFKTGDRPSV
jgi:hypothetical protein